jgi:hypothetical protein
MVMKKVVFDDVIFELALFLRLNAINPSPFSSGQKL